MEFSARTRQYYMITLFVVACLIAWHDSTALWYWHFLPTLTPINLIFLGAVAWAGVPFSFERSLESLQQTLIIYTPAATLFALTMHITPEQHYIFSVFATGTLFGWLLYFLWRTHQTPKEELAPAVDPVPRWHIAVLACTLGARLFFSMLHIGNEAYVDESLWVDHDRVAAYWHNIAERDWYNTRPSDKPGVTTALVAGPGLFFDHDINLADDVYEHARLPRFFASFRVPGVIVTTLLCVAFYWTLRRATGCNIHALVASSSIALLPLLLGMSRIVNPDALLWAFLPLAVIAYAAYRRTQWYGDLVAAGVFFGLALLTKYIAVLFFIYLWIELLWHVLQRPATERVAFAKTAAVAALQCMAIAGSVMILLYPGIWVQLDRLWLLTFGAQPFAGYGWAFVLVSSLCLYGIFKNSTQSTSRVLAIMAPCRTALIALGVTLGSVVVGVVLYNTYTDMSLMNVEHVLASPKSATQTMTSVQGALEIVIAGVYALIFAFPALAAALIGIGCIVGRKAPDALYSAVWIFVVLFYAGSIFADVAPTVRYQIVLYPLLLIMLGYGVCWIIERAQNNKQLKVFMTVAIVVSMSTTLWRAVPYYMSYNSPLLPAANIIAPKDMGEGSYNTAQWLNTLPHADDLVIWSDKDGVCTFFVGTCVRGTYAQDLEQYDAYDYYVVSRGGQSKVTRVTERRTAEDPRYPFPLHRLYAENLERSAIFELTPDPQHPKGFIRVFTQETLTQAYE